MVRVASVLLFMLMALSGCARSSMTEKDFTMVWDEFLKREFEESFDEKQSISQREKLMREISSQFSIRYNDLRTYMMKNHPDKYGKVFLNQ
jgi:hypothetical protein